MEWSESDLGLFVFDVPGGSKVHADPMRVRRELLTKSAGHIDSLAEKAASDMILVRAEGEQGVVATVRAVFNFPVVDESTGVGVPDEFCINLFNRFNDWMDQKKMSYGTTPTSSSPSGSPQDTV
jgi:hypothetical protein